MVFIFKDKQLILKYWFSTQWKYIIQYTFKIYTHDSTFTINRSSRSCMCIKYLHQAYICVCDTLLQIYCINDLQFYIFFFTLKLPFCSLKSCVRMYMWLLFLYLLYSLAVSRRRSWESGRFRVSLFFLILPKIFFGIHRENEGIRSKKKFL